MKVLTKRKEARANKDLAKNTIFFLKKLNDSPDILILYSLLLEPFL